MPIRKSPRKDETRMTSGIGHAVLRQLKQLNQEQAAGLLALQQYAWEHEDLELARRITDMMENPQAMSNLLEVWENDDIPTLVRMIEAGGK